MYKSIIDLAQEHPDINITVKAGELLEMVEYCINSTRKNLEQIIQDENQEKYLSPKKAAELLEINPTTLWRHNKSGYLKHVEIGGKRRYRLSDIKKILNA